MPDLHIVTPLIRSEPLSRHIGKEIWLKLECLQPTGSFKIRGIGHACVTHQSRGARHFISSSGGNAGIAVAYAGHKLGIKVTVVVPETTTQRAQDMIRALDAEVVVTGASWQEANAYAESLAAADAPLIHPFDDPLLWTGHATLIDEVVANGLQPDAIVTSVGGGGLMSGIDLGLSRNSSDAHLIAVETEGAASLAASRSAGELVSLDAITSRATSLGARQVCERSLQITNERPTTNVVLSDEQAVAACISFLDDHRLLVEPACGAALAVVYDLADRIEDFEVLLVVVCGGVTTSLDDLRR